MSAFGSAVPLLEGEGWAFLFPQTISWSDFITRETLTTHHFRGDQMTGLDGSFSPPALPVEVVLHAVRLAHSELMHCMEQHRGD